MFFSHEILAKKGPLFKVWLAAHWKDKLSKAQVFEVNINEICDSIMGLKVKMALRVSGHLLVGVVRIHSKKAVFLLEDCITATKTVAKKVKELELPASKKPKAAKSDVTLKQDFQIPDLDPSYVIAQLEQHNYSSDAINMNEPEAIRTSSFTRPGVSNLMSNKDDSLILPDPHSSTFTGVPRLESGNIDYRSYLATPIQHDGFGAPLGSNIFESLVKKRHLHSKESSAELPTPQDDSVLEPLTCIPETNDSETPTQQSVGEAVLPTDLQQQPSKDQGDKESELIIGSLEQTKTARGRPKKRKRLIVDKVKQFSSEEMRDRILDWDDTVVELDLAPPTAKLYRLKKTGTVQYVLHSITRPNIAVALTKLYNNRLKMRPCDNFGDEERTDLSTMQSMTLKGKTPQLKKTAAPLVEEIPIVQIQDAALAQEITAPLLEEIPNIQIQDAVLAQETVPSLVQEVPTVEMHNTNLVQEESEEFSSPTEALLFFCSAMKMLLNRKQEVLFTDIVHPTDNRKKVSLKFFQLLGLKKNSIIELQQDLPYSSIHITKGPYFDKPYSEVSV